MSLFERAENDKGLIKSNFKVRGKRTPFSDAMNIITYGRSIKTDFSPVGNWWKSRRN